MQDLVNIIGMNTFYMVISIFLVLLLLGFLIFAFKLVSLNKKYKNFMTKLGNGKSIEEDLANYMKHIEKIENQNQEIIHYCEQLNQDLETCIQKVGIVRYNAFQDTGSDLSFALALLDEKDNGIVLNGIYSREMSNIYAKPVENGKSNYTVSEQEEEAILKAMQSKQIYHVK